MVVQVLSEGALEGVYRDAKAVRNLEYRQLASFLRLFSSRRKNVSAVAREMDLSRMYVVRYIQPRALSPVSKRFLYLAEQIDPPCGSQAIRELLQYRKAS